MTGRLAAAVLLMLSIPAAAVAQGEISIGLVNGGYAIGWVPPLGGSIQPAVEVSWTDGLTPTRQIAVGARGAFIRNRRLAVHFQALGGLALVRSPPSFNALVFQPGVGVTVGIWRAFSARFQLDGQTFYDGENATSSGRVAAFLVVGR